MGLTEPALERYLESLLVKFSHADGIYAIRDAEGRPVTSIAGMLVEGDIRLNASSFAREREVHKHVGDLLLFWSGMFPEQLAKLPAPDRVIDCEKQARYSYYVASTFDHEPYAEEAPVLGKLSAEFERCRYGLRLVRQALPGLAA